MNKQNGSIVLTAARHVIAYLVLCIFQDMSEKFKLPLFSCYPPPKEYACQVTAPGTVRQGELISPLIILMLKENGTRIKYCRMSLIIVESHLCDPLFNRSLHGLNLFNVPKILVKQY